MNSSVVDNLMESIYRESVQPTERLTLKRKSVDKVKDVVKARVKTVDRILNCIIHNSISGYLLFLLKDKEIYPSSSVISDSRSIQNALFWSV